MCQEKFYTLKKSNERIGGFLLSPYFQSDIYCENNQLKKRCFELNNFFLIKKSTFAHRELRMQHFFPFLSTLDFASSPSSKSPYPLFALHEAASTIQHCRGVFIHIHFQDLTLNPVTNDTNKAEAEPKGSFFILLMK